MGVTYRHMGISYSLKDDKGALIFFLYEILTIFNLKPMRRWGITAEIF